MEAGACVRRCSRGRAVACLALTFVATACADLKLPPRATLSTRRSGDSRYDRFLDRWTRRAEVYNGLEARVFVAATFQSRAFREARVARVASFASLSPQEAEAMLAAERKAHGEAIEVFLGLHANERRFDDLARPKSIWRICLVGEAGEAVPLSIERVPRPDANLISLYPFLEPFWSGYRIRFPRTFANGAQVIPEGSPKAIVRLSSSVGKIELGFDLDPDVGGPGWP